MIEVADVAVDVGAIPDIPVITGTVQCLPTNQKDPTLHVLHNEKEEVVVFKAGNHDGNVVARAVHRKVIPLTEQRAVYGINCVFIVLIIP